MYFPTVYFIIIEVDGGCLSVQTVTVMNTTNCWHRVVWCSLCPWPYRLYHLPLYFLLTSVALCLQCFDTVGWAAGRASGLWKTKWWGAGVVVCLERGADLHMVQLMPLPLTVSCFSKIQIGFIFLVPAHPGSPRQRAMKWVCVCVCSFLYRSVCCQNCPLSRGMWPPPNTWFLGPIWVHSVPQTASRLVQPFCRAHGCDQLMHTLTHTHAHTHIHTHARTHKQRDTHT